MNKIILFCGLTIFCNAFSAINIVKKENIQPKVHNIINNNSVPYFSKLKILRSYGNRVLPVLRSIYNDENISFKDRWMAIMFFARVGGKTKSFEGLKEALNDRQWFIRSASAKAFGYMKNRKAVPILIETLEDRSLPVRTSAVDSLGLIGDKKAIAPLIKALSNPQNFYKGKSLWVRNHIVQALMEIGDPFAIHVLVGLLDDSDPKVVKTSLKALSRITGRTYQGFDEKQLISKWKSWYLSSNKFSTGNVSVGFGRKKTNKTK